MVALKIAKELNDKKGIADCYTIIGNIYKTKSNYAKAMEYQLLSLKIKKELDDKSGIAGAFTNIAIIYSDQANYTKAIEYNLASQKIYLQIGNKIGIADSYINIGNIYFKLNKFNECEKYQNLALNIGKDIGVKDIMRLAYGMLSRCDSASGNFKSAYQNYKLYKQYNDSIFNEVEVKKSAQMSAQYESERKDNEIQLQNKEKEKQLVLAEAESKKQKIIIWSVLVGLLLVIFFSIFIYSRWRITKHQKLIIENQKKVVDEKQKEILDSIRYAKRIQQSLLPTEKFIERVLKNKK